jgi:hypothetical protein
MTFTRGSARVFTMTITAVAPTVTTPTRAGVMVVATEVATRIKLRGVTRSTPSSQEVPCRNERQSCSSS